MKYILILLLLTLNAFSYDAFIKPQKLKDLHNSENLVLLDVSSASSYSQSHISRALHVNISKFVKSIHPRLAASFSKSVQQEIKKLGIHEYSKVVIYSRNTNADHLNSSYLAMVLINHGFENVNILDGGYMAWVFEYDSMVSSKKSKAQQNGTYIVKKNQNILVSTDYLKKNLLNSFVLDSRETSEYNGQKKSKNTKILGHIAYAKSHYYRDNFFDDLTIKNDKFIEDNFISRLNMKKNKEVIVYGDTIFTASMN